MLYIGMQVLHGDCLELLPTLPDNSVHAICSDPPYHLLTTSVSRTFPKDGAQFERVARGFMGKEWDGGNIAFRPEVWKECLRVLRPGGHMAVFGGSRTHHRLWVAIEDAGFELRDTLMWVYGSGFPKSLDVSKAIDRHLGVQGTLGDLKTPGHDRQWKRDTMGGWGRPWMDEPEGNDRYSRQYIPATPEAQQWQGYGTALKPAYEPILLARKPLSGTVAENVLEWGTGGLNINGCRVGDEILSNHEARGGYHENWQPNRKNTIAIGRWPANVCHDGLQEPWARFFYCAKASKKDRASSKHPTVKPIRLIEWICKLITPPNGVILDPFAGSGTTGQAAQNLGFDCILIEREADYIADIQRRFQPVTLP